MKFKISKAISILMIICIAMVSSNVLCFAIAAKDYGWPTTNHTFIQKKKTDLSTIFLSAKIPKFTLSLTALWNVGRYIL